MRQPEYTCNQCDGTGLISLKDKGGNVIAGAYQYCVCYHEPDYHETPLNMDDFDFPMSSTFRAYSYEICNQYDPGLTPQHKEETKHIEHKPPDAHIDLDQLRGELSYIRKKLAEILLQQDLQQQKDKKKTAAPKPTQYGGMPIGKRNS